METRKTYRARNPLTGALLEPVYTESLPEKIDNACAAAAEAFVHFGKTSGAARAHLLNAIAEEILKLGDSLTEMAHRETGLPIARLQGERGRTVAQLQLFAQWVLEGSWVRAIIDTALPERQPLPKPDVRQMQVPLGPVAVFGASNFPLAFSVAGGDTASALAAGCPVVFKAHPAHPGTCELVAGAIKKAVAQQGLPPGVFEMVHGASNEVGSRLVQHPAIKAVGFTGSFAGGKALFDIAAKRPEPIPVYAEMGSVNPVFFLPEALDQRAAELAEKFATSITLGSGQFCTNPGVFALMNNAAGHSFVALLQQKLATTQVGPLLTTSIEQQYLKGVKHLAATAAVHPLTDVDELTVKPHLFTTAISAALQTTHITEEIFGPCSVGVFANSPAEMEAFASSLKGQLTATVHGTANDLKNFESLLEILQQRAGRIIINGFPTGVEVTHAMMHGGPFPATTDSRSTSVGTQAIYRFTRPVCFQDYPAELLPEALQNHNPLQIMRLVNGTYTREKI